jgi:hypothetical protein
MSVQVSYDQLIEKWSPVLKKNQLGKIKDHHRKAVTAAILENQERAFAEEAGMLAESPTNTNASATGGSWCGANWNPVLIALVRRAMPNLMAYDLAGVQPMTGPTGLIFAMKFTLQDHSCWCYFWCRSIGSRSSTLVSLATQVQLSSLLVTKVLLVFLV